MSRCDESIKKLIEISEHLLKTADEGDNARKDESCGVLFGVSRDFSYKIRKMAEQELKKHSERKRKQGV